MRKKNLRWALITLITVSVAFVALGGPVVAKNFIDGGDIAPGTVGGRQIANGAISARKLSRRARNALAGRAGPRGAAGARGATGPQGPAGANGGRGPAGAYRFVDRNGTLVGDSVGYYVGVYPQVRTADGVIITFDNDPGNSNATPLAATLYYQQAACAGPAYGGPGLPFESAIILASPASPGSQIYRLVNGTPQSFTAASARTSAGCAASTTRLTNAFEAQAAGTVPAVVKPLRLVPAG